MAPSAGTFGCRPSARDDQGPKRGDRRPCSVDGAAVTIVIMSDQSPFPTAPDRQDGLAVMGVFLGLLAVIGAIVGVGLGVRAVDDAKRPAAATAATAGMTPVTLSEFKLDPATISVAAG